MKTTTPDLLRFVLLRAVTAPLKRRAPIYRECACLVNDKESIMRFYALAEQCDKLHATCRDLVQAFDNGGAQG
jgi:hypothetical protein